MIKYCFFTQAIELPIAYLLNGFAAKTIIVCFFEWPYMGQPKSIMIAQDTYIIRYLKRTCSITWHAYHMKACSRTTASQSKVHLTYHSRLCLRKSTAFIIDIRIQHKIAIHKRAYNTASLHRISPSTIQIRLLPGHYRKNCSPILRHY